MTLFLRACAADHAGHSRCHPALWLPLTGLILLLLLTAGSGCQRGAEKPGAAAAGDSLAAADSSDSTAKGDRRGFLSFFSRRNEEAEKEPPPVPVELAGVVRRDLSDRFSTTATLEAEKEAQVVAKTAGQVMRLLVEEGDQVTAGQELLRLDDREARVRLEQAGVKAANARREFERMEAMWKKGHASDREMADLRYQHEAAAAELELAGLRLAYTRVVAPFAGVIIERHIDRGENAVIGTPLVGIADREPLLARVHMPEGQVSRVEVGQEALVIPDAAPAELLRGSVTMISPRVDPRTGTVKVTVELAESSPVARPGSFVRVHIVTDTHPGALAIPKRALVSEGGEEVVFRAEGDSVVKVTVTTGFDEGDMIEVVSGLGVGDRVVRVGQGALKPGSRISAVAEADSKFAQGGAEAAAESSGVESTAASLH
jgi:membrane fusion protein (multidrug efflux system)